MKDLTVILENIRNAVERYQNQTLKFVAEQSYILRDLTTNLADLEVYRADYYDQWLNVYFTCKHTTDAARTKWSDNEVKELHRIRMVMRGAYKVVDSIRSTISSNKFEN